MMCTLLLKLGAVLTVVGFNTVALALPAGKVTEGLIALKRDLEEDEAAILLPPDLFAKLQWALVKTLNKRGMFAYTVELKGVEGTYEDVYGKVFPPPPSYGKGYKNRLTEGTPGTIGTGTEEIERLDGGTIIATYGAEQLVGYGEVQRNFENGWRVGYFPKPDLDLLNQDLLDKLKWGKVKKLTEVDHTKNTYTVRLDGVEGTYEEVYGKVYPPPPSYGKEYKNRLTEGTPGLATEEIKRLDGTGTVVATYGAEVLVGYTEVKRNVDNGWRVGYIPKPEYLKKTQKRMS